MKLHDIERENGILKSENEKLRAALDIEKTKNKIQGNAIDELKTQSNQVQEMMPETIRMWRELDSLILSKHYDRYRHSIAKLIRFFKENDRNVLLDFDVTSESRSWKDQEPEDINIFSIDVKYHSTNK